MKNFLLILCLAGLVRYTTAQTQNNCLDFNGHSTDVSLPYDPAIDFTLTDAFTMEIWFKTSYNTVVLFSNVVDQYPFRGFELSIVNGKAVFDLCHYHPVNQLRTETVINYNDGQWHHFAGVYYGNPSPASVKLYIDGNLQQVNTTHNSLTGPIASGTEFHIGSRHNTTYFVQGQLDEPRLWNRPLTYKEIVGNMHCLLSGNETGLVAHFNFNQGIPAGNNTAITTIPDMSPQGNNGTLSGFILNGPTANFVLASNGVSVACQTIPDPPTALTENNIGAFRVYPNPGRGEIQIQDLRKGDVVTICNALGSIVATGQCEGDKHNFNLTEKPNGIYLIEIRSGNGKQVFKYVKE